MIQESIRRVCVSKDDHIAVAFSGGVDSSLMATICKDAGYKTALLTVGFDNSHDVKFALKAAKEIGMECKIHIIDDESFTRVARMVIHAIPTGNISWIENCIAFYYVAMLAKNNDICTVLTANGIDELFCGYDSYRRMEDQSENAVLEAMDVKIKNELDMMHAISKFIENTSVKIIQPLLLKEFISYARNLPLDSKIRGSDDMLRKHAIRELAIKIGVPEMLATKRKKALQYGTSIHKNLLKSKSFSRLRAS
ncbi:MAG: asparagine synthase [Cenarchaeum symbiont of Oopsacas minuta]|nr:asparagine synthase [Cenarchaeum symbiont of Oopsacas minuta]